MDILVCSAAGRSASQTARSLNISRRTVEYHLTEMLRRTGSQNSVELVARCYAAGILVPGIWPPQWSGQLCLTSHTRPVAGQAGARADPG
jgi:DNA-binding CsgD family transcriptional regulator